MFEHAGKYSRAAMSFWNSFEIISTKFPSGAEIKLFQPDVDEGRNNIEMNLFHM